MTTGVAELAELIARSDSALFITGAGLSADSGLPTYRGVGGLYEASHTDEGMPIEVLLSGPMMAHRPELTWKYIAQIEALARGARPNRAHEVIAKLEGTLERLWVVTQNVDGFHERAGSSRIIELHGTLRRLRCTSCPWAVCVQDYGFLSPQLGTATDPRAPQCPRCGAVVRPDVVLFEEMLPEHAVATLGRELQRGFDLVVSVGTSSAFPYIAEPVVSARRSGATTVEINPGRSEVSDLVDLRIEQRALPVFEALWGALGRGASDRRSPG